MPARPLKILVLCTGNSARSLLGEALLNHHAQHRWQAFSAGSQPKGQPHPMALRTLQQHGISIAGLRSKSWNEFAEATAPTLDVVITVCDNAANETCPVWPGAPIRAHWGIPDPAAAPDSEQPAAFATAYQTLLQRITALSQQWPLAGDELPAALRRLSTLY